MSRVKVYIVSYNKPEFISVQANGFKKYCKDDYELIIVNNGIDPTYAGKIDIECAVNNLNSIKVPKTCTNEYCSQSHTQALEYVLNIAMRTDYSEGINVIMDNDVFPFREFSFEKLMNGNLLGGMYQQRDEHDYISAIFLMMDRGLDLSDFSFYGGIGDTGAAVQFLMRKYRIVPEYIPHTAQIDIESDYIFTCENDIPYKENYRSQFIAGAFFHYYRGSNWSESDPEYHKKKWKFTLSLLDDPKKYCLNLDDKVHYPRAHAEKGYNGSDHNYHGYRFVEMKKPS